MDGSDLGPAKRAWGLRTCESGAAERPERIRRVKMRDLEAVIQDEANRMSKLGSMASEQQNTEEGTSQLEEVNSSMISGRPEQVITDHSSQSPEQDAAYLSLVDAGTTWSCANQCCDDQEQNKRDDNKPCCSTIQDRENDPRTNLPRDIGRDLTHASVSSTVELNPFNPYRKIGQANPAAASECGSTTGPQEMSEPLKKWNQMKQNGFLSVSQSHGGIPKPKPRDRGIPNLKPRDQQVQPRKRSFKRKNEQQKRPQFGPYSKTAPPSGLLSGLDPGIIRHVRNSKQVYSIIEAMVRLEKQDGQVQSRFSGLLKGGESMETDDRRKDQNSVLRSSKNQFEKPSLPSKFVAGQFNELDMAEEMFQNETCATSQFDYENDDDIVALNPSSGVPTGSGNPSSAAADDLSAKLEPITSLSLKAATVASQWLNLLQEDIKGRLLALRRSKKRVRNAFLTELPYLSSSELSFNKENDPSYGHYSDTRCSDPKMHEARWSSLFCQMDNSLNEEARGLERWLREVQEMQLHCDKGLRNVNNVSQYIPSYVARKSSKPDEAECAVMAAAASIYSTCNMVMAKEKTPCF